MTHEETKAINRLRAAFKNCAQLGIKLVGMDQKKLFYVLPDTLETAAKIAQKKGSKIDPAFQAFLSDLKGFEELKTYETFIHE
jgi:hypothetical protein